MRSTPRTGPPATNSGPRPEEPTTVLAVVAAEEGNEDGTGEGWARGETGCFRPNASSRSLDASYVVS